MPDRLERSLEARVAVLEDALERLEEENKELSRSLEAKNEKLLGELTRLKETYSSLVAKGSGILFAIVAIGYAVSWALDFIRNSKNLLGGGGHG